MNECQMPGMVKFFCPDPAHRPGSGESCHGFRTVLMYQLAANISGPVETPGSLRSSLILTGPDPGGA
jgi:hypothetical protein